MKDSIEYYVLEERIEESTRRTHTPRILNCFSRQSMCFGLCYFPSNTSIWLIVLCTVSIIYGVQQRFIIVYLIDFAIIISVNGYLSIFCRVFFCRHNRGGTFNKTVFPLKKPSILIVIDNEAHSMCSLSFSRSLCVWKLKLERNSLRDLLETQVLSQDS